MPFWWKRAVRREHPADLFSQQGPSSAIMDDRERLSDAPYFLPKDAQE
jgi:hypothetical protein